MMSDRIPEDKEREHRIRMEAIVDAYDAEERAMGWYYYLDDRIQFPFEARCRIERSIAPLRVNEMVPVIGMSDEADCLSEMFVLIEWHNRTFGVPLAQLEPVDVDDRTAEAIADWHYWVERGYRLCLCA
jgi:hypothetical protein